MAARQRWHGKPKKEAEQLLSFVYLYSCNVFVVCMHTVPAQELRNASMCACVSVCCLKRAYETKLIECVCLCRAYTLSQTHILFILFSFFARSHIFRTRSCFFCCFFSHLNRLARIDDKHMQRSHCCDLSYTLANTRMN